MLQTGPTCIWSFWLRISSGIKSRSSDLNSWDTMYRKKFLGVGSKCFWNSRSNL